MYPLFSDYISDLQTEITQFEQKLAQKKQEAERLSTLENQIGQALNTLQNVVKAIQDVDEKAVSLIKEAIHSVFQGNSPSYENIITTPNASLSSSADNQQDVEKKTKTPSPQKLVEEKTTTHSHHSSTIQEEFDETSDEEYFMLSEQISYDEFMQTAVIRFDDKQIAQQLGEIFQKKKIAHDFKVREAYSSADSWELILYECSPSNATALADKFDDYLLKAQKALSKNQSELKYNQKVQIISQRFQKLSGLIGKVASRFNECGAYIQFDNGDIKYFWEEELQPLTT